MKRFDGSAFSDTIPPSFLYVASGYLLLWVAILNGYPVFYPDSAGYLTYSFNLKQPIFRTIGYSIFIRLINFASSPWLIVIAQSVIAIFVLYCVFKFIVRGLDQTEREALAFLGLVAFIAFGTTFPWFVGQIMPDVFTGLTLLLLFLLLYDADMKLGRSVLICFVFCISIGVHVTHLLAVGAVLLTVFILGRLSAFRWLRPNRPIKGIVVLVLIPMIGVAALTAISNWRVGSGFVLSPGKNLFLFARLMESGLAPAYLQQKCQTEELTPCKYLHNLPPTADELLWSSYPLLKDMGGWYGARGEAGRIVFGTIRYSPVSFVKECARQMFRQFVTFTPGDDNKTLSGGEINEFLELYPGEVPRYLLSRQSIGKLRKDAMRVTPIYAAVFWVSLGVCLMAPFSTRLRLKVGNQLLALTLIFLFVNALATGALSGVHPRYQARASWLMAMCCAAYLLPHVIQWRNKYPPL